MVCEPHHRPYPMDAGEAADYVFARPPYRVPPRTLARRRARKHIAGAGKGTAGGTERPADDRTDGTAGCKSPARLPLASPGTPHRIPGSNTPGDRIGWQTRL